MSIYTKYVSGKLGQSFGGGSGERYSVSGGGGEGVSGERYSVSRRRRVVRIQYEKKQTQMTFKMRSRSHNHCQIFVSCHLGKSMQYYYKYRNSSHIFRRDNNIDRSLFYVNHWRSNMIMGDFMQTTCARSKDNAKLNDSGHIFVIRENMPLKRRCPSTR